MSLCQKDAGPLSVAVEEVLVKKILVTKVLVKKVLTATLCSHIC